MNLHEAPCVEYAKLNGPVDEDEMAWCINLAKIFKSQGFTQEKAAMHLGRLAANGEQDEPLEDEIIVAHTRAAWGNNASITCSDLMASVSFLRGCAGEACPCHIQPIVPPTGPTAKRIYPGDPAGAYGIDEDGTVKLLKQINRKDGSTQTVLEWVSDCMTYIHTETIAAHERDFVFCGIGAQDKKKVKFCMPAADLADTRKFKAALINAFGAANRVGNLSFEIVQQITKDTIHRRRLCAPGWVDDKPIVPGSDLADDIDFRMPDMIPAMVHEGNIEDAKETLGHLLDIPGPTPILVAAIMGSPIYARWFLNDRFGVGVWGRTGSLKTSVAKKAMCIYGIGYNDDANLLKHGKSGSTAVGELEILAGAGILPHIIDNVKSVDPRDAYQYISIIHAVIEGKDKVRGKKDGGVRDSKPFFCTPIVTGEIKPDEASTSARILNLKWQEPKDKSEVDYVQEHIGDLPIIGYHWLRYLATVQDAAIGFNAARTKKTDEFNKHNYVNSGRLATIYALLRATWNLLCQSPFADVFEPRTDRFLASLERACADQGQMVSDETEVAKFMSGISAILTSQPHLFQEYENQMPSEYGKSFAKDVIGRWIERKDDPTKKDLFLIPEPTLNALKRLGVFTQVPTKGSITDTLSQSGYLVERSAGRKLIQQRMNDQKVYGWMIRGEILKPPESAESISNDITSF